MRLAKIGPAKFLPQMASKPSTVHESWSLKIQPDHVLRSSHAEAQGKMNKKTALYELYALGLCPSAISFKTEPLVQWEKQTFQLGGFRGLFLADYLSDYTLMTCKFMNKYTKKLPNS